ncbi:unnamed protein product [Heligmosomoides polygyrus]|uniref:PUM-HD domain-containing protein n=1 Tax=Heligmosomoides polygyrus TaxID=6339 RepID=A0A183GSC0_HELPZ|nr:unnamed protein product [Heligmosomoides polygyrus]
MSRQGSGFTRRVNDVVQSTFGLRTDVSDFVQQAFGFGRGVSDVGQDSGFRRRVTSEGSNGNRTVTGSSGSNCTSTNGATPSQKRNVVLRRPLHEVPTFSGDFREFNAFWSVFQALIHNAASLTDYEKFLFLKQALKGQAVASITYVPVIGNKHYVAVNILKKQYDRPVADILINEIQKISRAHNTPRACARLYLPSCYGSFFWSKRV